MAVVNSTFQIVLPGIDANAQANLNAAINSNATIAQIISNFALAGSPATLNTNIAALGASLSALPSSEPYPYFGTYSNFNNQPYASIWDSNMRYSGSAEYDTNAEMHSTWTGNNYTNGNIGSNGWTSYWAGATPFNQADGHWMFNISNANYGYYHKNPDAQESYMPFYGVVVGTSGKRQKISLYLNGTTLAVATRGAFGFMEQVGINSGSYSTWYGGTTYGMIGYNERTSTLVALEAKDGNNNYRMHIWVNTSISLNDANYHVGTLNLFLSQAKLGGSGRSYNYYDFQWQANSSQNYNESRYRMRVIPGDNNIVGLARMVPSNVSAYAYYTPSSSTLTQLNTIALTTSYGIDNGNKYGMRHQITWDNNWVAAYNAYYYYGSGMNVYFIDSRDPRNYFIGQNGDTGNGQQLVPFKSNKFMFNRSIENSDGNIGMRLYVIDPEGAKTYGRVTSGTITNGGTINLTANQQYGLFDTWYTSTNYPHLVPVAHWRRGEIR